MKFWVTRTLAPGADDPNDRTIGVVVERDGKAVPGDDLLRINRHGGADSGWSPIDKDRLNRVIDVLGRHTEEGSARFIKQGGCLFVVTGPLAERYVNQEMLRQAACLIIENGTGRIIKARDL